MKKLVNIAFVLALSMVAMIVAGSTDFGGAHQGLVAGIIAIATLFVLGVMFFPKQKLMGVKVGGNGSVIAQIFTSNLFLKLFAVTVSFFITMFLVDYVAVKNAAYLSFTIKMFLSGAILGSVLMVVILIMAKANESEVLKNTKGFVSAASMLYFAVAGLSLILWGYSYYNPRFFNPYTKELTVERMIDPETYKDFPMGVTHNPETGTTLRKMTVNDVEKVKNKRREKIDAVIGKVDSVFISEYQNSQKASKPQAQSIRPQVMHDSLRIVYPSKDGDVVERGREVTVAWEGHTPGMLVQFNWKADGEDWSAHKLENVGTGLITWVPSVSNKWVLLQIGVYDYRTNELLAAARRNVFVQDSGRVFTQKSIQNNKNIAW